MRKLEKIYREEKIAREGKMVWESEAEEREKEKQRGEAGSQEGERQGRTRDKDMGDGRIEKETKMIRHEGRLRYIEDIKDYEEVIKNQHKNEEVRKFNASHRGIPILEVVLNPRLRSSDKDTNTVKIIQHIKKLGCNVERIKNCGFGKAEVAFIDVKNANKCIEKCSKDIKRDVQAYIPNRAQRCRGIIKDWDLDMPLHELVEAMDDSSKISQIERMKKKGLIFRTEKQN